MNEEHVASSSNHTHLLTCMDVTDNNALHPSVTPVNHNFLNEAKTDN